MVIEGSYASRLAPPLQQSISLSSSTETPVRNYIAYALNALIVGDPEIDLRQTKEHRCTHTSEPKNLCERLLLTVVTVAKLLQENHTPVTKFMAYALLLHALLLSDAQLSRRRQKPLADKDAADEDYSSFVSDFSNIAKNIMQDLEWQRFAQSMRTTCDIADLIDGRLLKTLLHSHKEDLDTLIFRTQLATRIHVLVQAVCVLSGVHLEISDSSQPTARLPIILNGHKAEHGNQDIK